MPSIAVIGLNHKTATLAIRESVSFSNSQAEEFLSILRESFSRQEFVIVSTCNRVEIYIGGTGDNVDADRYISLLSSYHNVPKETISPVVYCHTGDGAVEHLFEVASGLDSLVIGEVQILGQMKMSYQKALQAKTTAGTLNTAFQKAFNVAKKIRTVTSIGKGNLSIGSISCQLAEKVLKGLARKKVLLIGTGKAGTMAFKSLRGKGADAILVSSRNYERAEALSQEFNGKAVRFEDIEHFMVAADIVISSTSAPHYILHPEMLARIMKIRGNRPVFLIDLAVPRDIDPAIGEMQGVHLYNIDSLRNIAAENMKRREGEILRCKDIISHEVNSFSKKVNVTSPGKEEDDKLFETVTA